MYDHIINEDTDVHSFGPIVNTKASKCTFQYFFIEKETSPDTWINYSGPLVTID